MLISLIVCKEPITADEVGGTLGAVGGDMDDAGGESGGYGESDGEALGSSVFISWVVCKGDKRGLEVEQDDALGNHVGDARFSICWLFVLVSPPVVPPPCSLSAWLLD